LTVKGTDRSGVLTRYFQLLDSREVDDLVEMYAEDGVMITKGGTDGRAIVGKPALREFYADRGPSVNFHTITSAAESPSGSFAEGLVAPREGDGETKFFIATASLDGDGKITRYTTLVWPTLTREQVKHLVGEMVV
jgi:SnoaL-like protein